ncbi:hypothetical protein B0A50_07842 [Salinomyces thailandicus]|uniref:Dynactin subunit n=1 Tax=Salinomyces thailandicus TaxID=706561 RepID=A0A4U0TLS3_9PEZI|nr:hypothetical protein B0A50_07842 [Salinomyces thailandica]
MTETSRLAALPGYDTAPDVYETPAADLTDSTSTATRQTSPASPSESSATSEEDDGEADHFGVSRRRLFPSQARSHFTATSRQVEARSVDLSDRVDGRRRGYKVRSQGRAVDVEDEGLQARIARLRREIEECRAEAAQAGNTDADEDGEDDDGDEEGNVDGLESLSKLLSSVEMPQRQGGQARTGPSTVERIGLMPEAHGDTTDEQTLSRVTDFDTRLSALEQTLGISSLATARSDAVATPVLPSLILLDQQLTALSSASSLTNLEAASTRINKLRKEAQQLSGSEDDDEVGESDSSHLSPEDLQKLKSLYQLLPNLQSLAPTVPAIVARLRSLRTLHTTAANAASSLDELEQKQAEMDLELTAWREGLEKVEGAVNEAGEANGRNGKMVEGWIKDLEGRMRALRA